MNEYENPMVIGDYGEIDKPDYRTVCGRCKTVWVGYECDGEVEWECDKDSVVLDNPVSKHWCRACAWVSSTNEHRRRFVESEDLGCHVLAYLLHGRIMNATNGNELWDVLIDSADSKTQEWVDTLISDFIHDECMSEFVDWMMAHG